MGRANNRRLAVRKLRAAGWTRDHRGWYYPSRIQDRLPEWAAESPMTLRTALRMHWCMGWRSGAPENYRQ